MLGLYVVTSLNTLQLILCSLSSILFFYVNVCWVVQELMGNSIPYRHVKSEESCERAE